MVDGHMIKRERGKSSVDQIAKENPAMARFMKLGKFAHGELNALGYAVGNMTNLASSDRKHQFETEDGENKAPPDTWTQTIIVSVSETYQKEGHPSTRIRKYECVMHVDPKKYVKRVVMLHAWVLDNDTDERTEPELYIPEHEEKTWLHKFGPHFVTICGVVVCSGLAKWLRTGAIVLYKFIVGNDQDSKKEEDAADTTTEGEKNLKTDTRSKDTPAKKKLRKRTPKA
eukprot:FR737605.1.p1 GENE.FR737605.1~~FR737605.1.p1  ORF type:complete len:263 (+),score=28.26 FR737605.1:108-791(+)